MNPIKYALIGALLCGSGLCSASWKIDEQQSLINFSSTKTLQSGQVMTEAHEISRVVGQVDDQGFFHFKLDTRTLNTHIPIRDTRLKQHLFHTTTQPWIQVTGKLTAVNLDLLSQSSIMALIEQPFKVDINGHVVQLIGQFKLEHQMGKTTLELYEPLVVTTDAFEMSQGIRKLTELAGLANIKKEVPVQIHLEFNANAT